MTQTGGRLLRVKPYLDPGETFCMTYGDGLSDIDISASIDFHNDNGKEATLTAITPPGRYGALTIEDRLIMEFKEKPAGDGNLINGGFFVLEPSVLDRISGDSMPWELDPLTTLAEDNQLTAFRHNGFWQHMDTLRDKNVLEELWASGNAPWKKWDQD